MGNRAILVEQVISTYVRLGVYRCHSRGLFISLLTILPATTQSIIYTIYNVIGYHSITYDDTLFIHYIERIFVASEISKHNYAKGCRIIDIVIPYYGGEDLVHIIVPLLSHLLLSYTSAIAMCNHINSRHHCHVVVRIGHKGKKRNKQAYMYISYHIRCPWKQTTADTHLLSYLY